MHVEFTDRGVAKLRGITYKDFVFLANRKDERHNTVTWWRNFSGAQTAITPQGQRYFNLDLPKDIADQMKEFGFTNIKDKSYINSNTGEEVWHHNLKVLVKYYEDQSTGRKSGPTVVYVDGGVCRYLDADTVCMLDDAAFDVVDMDIYLGSYIDVMTKQKRPKALLNNLRFVSRTVGNDFLAEFGLDKKQEENPVALANNDEVPF